jgi:hypothetical protein
VSDVTQGVATSEWPPPDYKAERDRLRATLDGVLATLLLNEPPHIIVQMALQMMADQGPSVQPTVVRDEVGTALLTQGEPPALELADDFGDPHTLLNSRAWLQKALEKSGGKMFGGGIGGGQADLDVRIEGFEFNVSIKPIVRPTVQTSGSSK